MDALSGFDLQQYIGLGILLVIVLTMILRASRGEVKQTLGIGDQLEKWKSSERIRERIRWERLS
jgi:hypothetical protein